MCPKFRLVVCIHISNSEKSSTLDGTDASRLPTKDVTRQTCEFAPTFPTARGIMTYDWSIHRPATAPNGGGVAAEQAAPFNTDYADASLKASRRGGCIVILPIVFPLSEPDLTGFSLIVIAFYSSSSNYGRILSLL